MYQGSMSARNCLHRQSSCYSGGKLVLRNRSGFTVLELLVTFGIITTLASLILPAVNSAREAARQLQCKNQLKQIGLALHSYHDGYRCLPAGWQWERTNHAAYGWAVPL
ncbi:MAG: hypothetical protein CME31_10215, partial [Gimesia sp.]|nr:hypothetical protein [Gimesia sp.]HCO24117.1 hypothetical protein [Gimesia maris]